MRLKIRDQHFSLLPGRAAFWEEEKILICSDLHWGRENYLQKFGMAIPAFSFENESPILFQMLNDKGAKELWILGDFIHHPNGLDSVLIEKLTQWLQSLERVLGVKVSFIPGNHDREYNEWASLLPIEIYPEGIKKGEFMFLHEPLKQTSHSLLYHWYGHLHPALRIPKLFGHRKLPCFWMRENEAYLPAFSRLAGGAVFETEAYDRTFPIAENQVFEWPPTRQ